MELDIWNRGEMNQMRKKIVELESHLVELGKQQEKKKRKRDEEKKAATTQSAAAAAAAAAQDAVLVMCCPHCSRAFKVTVSK
jgi:TolA-binding protein